MSNLSTFFGGGSSGGGSGVAQAPNVFNGLMKNVTPLQANTLTGFTASGRGSNPHVIPCGDNNFFLLEGNSTSKVYASYWSLASDGTVSEVASAVQVGTDCDEVGAASSNGTDRMMVLGGTNYNKMYSVYYNGSTINTSQLYANSGNSVANMCMVTSLYDGTLLGCIGDFDSTRQVAYTAVLFNDGTTDTRQWQVNITSGSGYGRVFGTGQGLYAFGPKHNATSLCTSAKIRIMQNRETACDNHNVNLNTSYMGGGKQTPPFMYPHSGGIRVLYQENNDRHFYYNIEEREGRALLDQGDPFSNGFASPMANYNISTHFGNGQMFVRQSNGHYMYFGGGSNTAEFVTFNESTKSGFKTPFRDLVPMSTYISGDSNPRGSTLMGSNIVLRSWTDGSTGTKIFMDAYTYNG